MIFLPERVLLLFGISTLILPIAVSDNEPPENGVNAEVRGVLADLVMEALHPPEVVKSGRITIEEWRGIRRERRLFDAAFKKWVDDHPGDRLDWGQTIHMQKIVNVRDMVQAKFFDESALVPRMRRYAHVFDGYHGDLKWGYKCLEPELCEIMNYRYFSVLFAWLPRDPIVNLTLVEQRVTDYKSKARARLASKTGSDVVENWHFNIDIVDEFLPIYFGMTWEMSESAGIRHPLDHHGNTAIDVGGHKALNYYVQDQSCYEHFAFFKNTDICQYEHYDALLF